MSLVKFVFSVGPLLFAFGFLTPLIAQTMAHFNVSAPFGLGDLPFALLISGVLGVAAQIRGRWLW